MSDETTTKVDIVELARRKKAVRVYNNLLGLEAEQRIDHSGMSRVERELLTMKAITVCLATLLDKTVDMLKQAGMISDEDGIVH